MKSERFLFACALDNLRLRRPKAIYFHQLVRAPDNKNPVFIQAISLIGPTDFSRLNHGPFLSIQSSLGWGGGVLFN